MADQTVLHNLRTHSGMTQVEVARRVHIARTTYAGYETGKFTPPPTILSRIARIFGVSAKTLTDRDFELMCRAWCGMSEEQRHIISRQAQGMAVSRQQRLGAKTACEQTQDIIICPKCELAINISNADGKLECPKCGQKIKVEA